MSTSGNSSAEELRKRTEEILARTQEGAEKLRESTAPYVLVAQEEARRRLGVAEAKERENGLRTTALNAKEQALDEITAMQEDADRSLKSREGMVSSREDAVHRNEDALNTREQRLASRETATAEKERQLSRKERDLAAVAENLETAQGRITSKQEELDQREDMVAAREQETVNITALSAIMARTINELGLQGKIEEMGLTEEFARYDLILTDFSEPGKSEE